MVTRAHIIIVKICLFILFTGCASEATSIKDQISIKYNKGIELYKLEKYSKAKELFEYVILYSAGSRLALESEFYLAESLYNLKEYEEAIFSYDNYARSSQNLELIELSRFRLCQCSYNLTDDYKKDQVNTIDALEKINIFLEDYPDSEYGGESILLREKLIYRLAKKEYESARLYMKLGEYESALIYLYNILQDYNDIDIADDARLLIILSYIMNNKLDLVNDFYKREVDEFNSLEKRNEALALIESSKDGSKFSNYLRLFK
tara:strand:+ start:209 stop:997 length:789 start_codon:yes stop_codon:yes gene_type:complete